MNTRFLSLFFLAPSVFLWQCLGFNDSNGNPNPIDTTGCESNPLSQSSGRPLDADLQHCADVINAYRDSQSLPHLARSPALEAFAAIGACWDAHVPGTPHSHFKTKAYYQLTDAENELPNWPLGYYRSIAAILDQGTKLMWDEGPGGGHYENMIGDHTAIGCGIYIAADSGVWVTQDFK